MEYLDLNPEFWSISKAATSKLKLTTDGYDLVGNDTLLKLTGYQIPALLTADTAISDIEPAWIINKVTGELLLNHAKSARLDIEDREKKGSARLEKAEKDKASIRTRLPANTRWID
jgi:hypothetical protein